MSPINLNKAMLHTDTHMHTYIETESVLIVSETPATTVNDIDIALLTSENTEAEPQEKPEPSLQSRGVHSRGVTLEVGLDCAGKIKEVEERLF